jgi:hypothetical protein
MEKWQKKININDVNSFLPDNTYYGTKDFFENKYNNMLLDGMSEVLETESRKEHDELDVKESIENFKNKMKLFNEQVDLEFKIAESKHIITIADETNSEENERPNTPIEGIYNENDYKDIIEFYK